MWLTIAPFCSGRGLGYGTDFRDRYPYPTPFLNRTGRCCLAVCQRHYRTLLNDDGTLTYTFVQSVKASIPFYIIRLVGGLLYLSGMVVMLWNTVMTARQGLKVGTLPAVQIPAVAAHA